MRVEIIKVVSKNVIKDIVAKLQNFTGQNLTSYETMIKKAISLIEDEIAEKELKFKWYRYEITELTNGAVAVMFYGDTKK